MGPRHRGRGALLCAAMTLSACSGDGGARRGTTTTTTTASTQPARPGLFRRFTDAVGLTNVLPQGVTGITSLVRIGNYRLELRPSLHDPLTALGTCADLVTYCYQPPRVGLDQCVAAARPCQTAEPWRETECCPTACQAAYGNARRAGQDPVTAFQGVFFQQPDCFPGVRRMLATGQ